jgi:hypothetical protein
MTPSELMSRMYANGGTIWLQTRQSFPAAKALIESGDIVPVQQQMYGNGHARFLLQFTRKGLAKAQASATRRQKAVRTYRRVKRAATEYASDFNNSTTFDSLMGTGRL